MATYRAVEAASAAVVGLLDDTFDETDFAEEIEFEVIDGGDFASGLPSGAGIFAYRIEINGTRRHPSGRIDPTGQRELSKLPVDVHLLVVVSVADARTKLALTGWIMRTLEDHPVLPSALLNRDAGEEPVFRPDETVEVAADHVTHEELLHLWEVLGAAKFDVVLLTYVLRNVLIESNRSISEAAEVQERLTRFGHLEAVTR
ncbi:Pvc16 family protein [Nocardioides gilvus]|uniref:Pvc16 family protein n=1 Tax=Nocardioides gilvus TaxID=1735589 RepID=UPI000D743B0E|nr:Pvc16 family protein [Nocardioides gilvus]